jgi:type III restriction enzyme
MILFELESAFGCGYDTGVIATSYRYIVQRRGVRSGRPIVEGTRIGVHDVVAMTKTGASVDEVVASFPRLTRAQVYECLAYYEDHQSDLDPLIAAQTASLDE